MNNQEGDITHFTDLNIQTSQKKLTLHFLITNLGQEEAILGYPWLTTFKPKFHWQDATLDREYQPVIISTIGQNIEDPRVCATMTEEEWEDVLRMDDDEPYALIQRTTTASELAQRVADKTVWTFEEMVPEEYHQHCKVFSEEQAQQFPARSMWNHAIDLLPDTLAAIDCKVSVNSRRRQSAGRLHTRAVNKRVYMTIKIPLLLTVLLHQKERWQITTSSGLSMSQHPHC